MLRILIIILIAIVIFLLFYLPQKKCKLAIICSGLVAVLGFVGPYIVEYVGNFDEKEENLNTDNNYDDSDSNNEYESGYKEINVGNQAVSIIGDNNTVYYGDTRQDNIKDSESNDLMSESDDLTVVASHYIAPMQISDDGIDEIVTAITNFPAEYVTISALSDGNEEKTYNMHGSEYNWYFDANFYIKGTYTVTITAYSSDGHSVFDVFEYTY